MADFPSIEPDLEEIALIANNQVYNSPLTGQAQTASLTGAKWQCTPTFSNRNGKEARDLRAFLFDQEGVSGRFNYYPASIDNIGTHAGVGVVNGAGQTGKSLLTKGWNADQPLLFSAGDYLTVNGEMKMVTADVAVDQDYIEYDETNYMPSPFDPSGWANNPTNTVITNIAEQNPSGQSFVGEVEQVGTGTDAINDFSGLSVQAGDKVFMSILVKNSAGLINGIRFRFGDSGGFLAAVNYDVVAGSVFAIQGLIDNVRIQNLSNGFNLVEASFLVADSDPSFDMQIRYTGNESIEQVPPIGSKIKVQAAFAGIADSFQAKLRANATIPITPAIRVSPSDENAIEVENPYFPARLDTDDMSRLQVSSPVIYNTTLSIVEDF